MRDPIRRWHVIDHFFDGALTMRRGLDRGFDEKRDPFDARRFRWERWHVHAQFSQLRAPARAVFGEALDGFEMRLISWAKSNLGLSRLAAAPWVSSLTDGDFQSLHRDTPNGTFAFTYGLSKRGARFLGGETLIARDELLDYWRSGAHEAGEASSPMFEEIASRFDRLVVFDSRIPHGVRAVEGPRHPREGRIAIQGWLAPAGVIDESGKSDPEANARADAFAKKIPKPALAGVRGLCSVKIDHGRARILASTLVEVEPRGNISRAEAAISRACARMFPRENKAIPLFVTKTGARLAE